MQGECLDNNEPPLVEWVKPQINHNVIGDSIDNVTSVTQCAENCLDNPECRLVLKDHTVNILSVKSTGFTFVHFPL